MLIHAGASVFARVWLLGRPLAGQTYKPFKKASFYPTPKSSGTNLREAGLMPKKQLKKKKPLSSKVAFLINFLKFYLLAASQSITT